LLFILFVIFISLPVISSRTTSPPENVLKDAIRRNNKIENKDDCKYDHIFKFYLLIKLTVKNL